MAANLQALTALDDAFKAPLLNFIGTAVQGVSTFVSPVLSAALTIYVAALGLGIATGRVSSPVGEFLWRTLKIGVILLLVNNVGNYQTYVTELAYTTVPQAIAAAVGGTGTGATATMWDAVIVQAENIKVQMAISSGTGLSSIGANVVAAVAGAIVIFCTGCMAAVGFVVGLYANMALALVLALGPIFIAAAMFDATRPFCERWIGTVVNYIILKVLVVAISVLLLQTYAALLANAIAGNFGDMLSVVGGVCAYCFVAIYLFYELPSIAAGLAGGASLSSGMIVPNPINPVMSRSAPQAAPLPPTPPKV